MGVVRFTVQADASEVFDLEKDFGISKEEWEGMNSAQRHCALQARLLQWQKAHVKSIYQVVADLKKE